MAGNNYKLLIEGQLSTDKIEATIKSLQNKVKLNFQLDDNSLRELEKRLANITGAGGKVGKIKLFEDDAGRINKAVVEYTNSLGQVERRTEVINEKVKSTHTRYVDINKALAERAKVEKELQKLTAKQADEMARASQSADKFLIKAQGMKSSPQLADAVNLAQQIKVAASDGNIDQVRKLSQQFDLAKTAVAGVNSGVRSFGEGLKHAIKQTVEYALSIGLIYGALRQIKEGIAYVTELNTEMTKIQVLQVEGAQTNEQIADLALIYNDLAKEVGSTTVEVAKGSVEWLRQGKSIEETGELLKSTMYLSKLGALESAQATEYLTAILNGFNMEASKAEDVVSKLVSIDNIAATSAGELATALQYSSAVSNEAGVSFENLAAMIGAVSSNTRLSAEMIGTAFRTMMVRMQQVKAGAIDETGLSLNNVEKTLANVNIALRDSADSFRPLEDVIADVALRWDELTEIQKAQISNAIAG